MRRRLSAIILGTLLFLPVLPALADDIQAVGKIDAVTVYADRATLTRRTVVDIPAGAHRIVFGNLPADLDTNSLRAEGQGDAAVILGAISHRTVNTVGAAIPRERELNDQIRGLTDQRQMLEAERQVIAARQTFYNTLIQKLGEQAQTDIEKIDVTPDKWQKGGDIIATGLSQAARDTVQKTFEIRAVDEQIAKLNFDLEQMRSAQGAQYYEVSLPVEAAKPARLEIDLSYQIPNVSWQPVYDARLNTATGALGLVQYGTVSQRSGEDWNDVRLTLSTAQPQQGVELPPSQPMWVSLEKDRPEMAFMTSQDAAVMTESRVAGGMESLSQNYKAVLPPGAPVPAYERHARIDTGGFVAEYQIPGRVNVPADGSESKVLIGPFETENKLQIHVKPQTGTQAFLVSRVTLKGDAPILPGAVSLFRDGAYVGQTMLPLTRPGKETDLGFGSDEQVAVTRKVLADATSESGLIAKNQTLERQFVTEIQNLHAGPVEIIVQEVTPAPQDEQIVFEIDPRSTTPGYQSDVENIKGLRRWTLPLKPREKAEVKLGWKLSWPRDADLRGLD